MANADDFVVLARLCEKSLRATHWRDQLREEVRLIKTSPLKYEIPDGKRLLSVSRAAKDRVLLLSHMYRLTQEERFADRAWVEFDTVTRFQAWNPSHFLDTAEMTFAVAIGYDWLHDVWNEDQRRQLRQAIVSMGLEKAGGVPPAAVDLRMPTGTAVGDTGGCKSIGLSVQTNREDDSVQTDRAA